MRALVKASAAPFAAAAVFIAQPATARQAVVPLEEIQQAYDAVCVAHPGDGEAQIAAIKGLTGSYKEIAPTDDGTRNFDNGRVLVRVLDNEKVSFCGAVGQVASQTRIDDLIKAGTKVYGEPDLTKEDAAGWMRSSGDIKVTYVYMLDDQPDGLEAALLLGVNK